MDIVSAFSERKGIMEVKTYERQKKDGSIVNILQLSEMSDMEQDFKAFYEEIRDFVRTLKDSDDEEYALLKVADLDIEGKTYEYMSVECMQKNIFKAMKTIIEKTYDFKTPISVTKRRLKKTESEEKKNQFIYTLRYILKEDYCIPKGEYLYHENELIHLYGSIDKRIEDYKYKTNFSIEDFEKKERYDSNKLSFKENLSNSFIERVLKLLVGYEMGMSAKDTFFTCIAGYAVKCETFNNEINIDFDVEGATPDETDKLFYERNKDILSDAFSELIYGISVFEPFSKLKRGLSDESIISACQLAGYKIWYDDTEKAQLLEISNSRTENVPNGDTIKNIRIMANRIIEFLDREGDTLAFNFSFDDDECSGYSEVISEGEGEILTEYGIFVIDTSNKVPDNKMVLKSVVHYIMAIISQIPIFDDIMKFGIINPRLNTCYYMYIENVPNSVIREVKQDLICYR